MEKIRVIQCGLGPIGRKLTRYLNGRDSVEVVGALDIDPELIGRPLGELAESSQPLDVRVAANADELGDGQADVAALTTSSQLEKAAPQILDFAARGWHVVSTCEELSFPWITRPRLSRRLDEAAKKSGVAILGTGVNPGFLMDYLPAAATGVCRSVERILVERVQDAGRRRLPFQEKIGAGLVPEAFQRRVREGSLRHVGLTESMHLIATALGWKLDRVEDAVEPIVAEREVAAGGRTIPAGRALGVLQTGRGWVRGAQAITLVFRAAIGQKDPRDRIAIQGDPSLEILIPGGVNGDIATCAITANAIPAILKAPPGLRTMADMPLISCRP